MKKNKVCNDEIRVSNFKEIQIHFPGDVYLLAVWTAMSNRAKSTSTCKPHTTLHGLASIFSSVYGIDYENPLSSEDVMNIFRSQGIKGNPVLKLYDEDQLLTTYLQV